ncbi:polysaccharide deacetylase family protein [Rhizobiaceae bacterium n13]|uniref:Polysaccharide deacetylase family protein n=1 Tax=Ferirhizobium litorale TaxID=2927786 RepID=A0AAE3U1U3_9HYPH|nr:polysaccharide deacetylase family protein [Fererhizobium litorale]MDI7861656.1 polysaccharide deacetylase family protein [Fererhizobium litorale]MDI7922002.1 polysaccharide deacetylase family protein [Fererhizobium litorale]
MSASNIWHPLLLELDRWQAAGRQASLWLRDDDAIEPTPALERLLSLTGSHHIPVALAVIPAHTGERLARHLDSAPHTTVVVHGWSHRNYASPQEKKQELGLHRPPEVVLEELAKGLTLLEELHRLRIQPVLVPPWNRIDSRLVPELEGLGYEALSVYGPEKTGTIRQINTHVDLMDWHGTRGGRPHDVLALELAANLARTFESGGAVGFLTHHLVHDEMAWGFLEELFAVMEAHPGCRWHSIGDVPGATG